MRLPDYVQIKLPNLDLWGTNQDQLLCLGANNMQLNLVVYYGWF